jgi:FixJ family two-component response regulator
VDDEKPVRDALRRLLRAAGMKAEAFASGPEFLDSVSSLRPDCVVLDLHIPIMSGQEILRRIRELEDPIAVVIITAHDTPEARSRCLASGAAAYLSKPLDDGLLLAAITAAIAEAGRREHKHSIKETKS